MAVFARKSQNIWRVIDLINWGESYFKEHNFDNPRKEIEVLLQGVLQCKRVDLYLRFEEPFSSEQLNKLRSWVQRRKNNEPIQYITGKAGFHNLVLDVTSDVLIPRPESERLVEILVADFDKDLEISILDIGTGSGCLALAIANEMPNSRIVGIDKSIKAIKIAKANALTLKIQNVEFLELNILEESLQKSFDVIISNPPYIPKSEMDDLMPEVQNFEPRFALTDEFDGLAFYHRISEIGNVLLKPNGWIYLEVGLGKHPDSAMSLFLNDNYMNVELIKDYNGDDRVLKAQIV